MNANLANKKCLPCEGGIPSLNQLQVDMLKNSISAEWTIEGTRKLTRKFSFVNFRHSIAFANKVAGIAEEEGHHPDLHIYYANVIVEIYTHAVDGLSENDFILAAKIDNL